MDPWKEKELELIRKNEAIDNRASSKPPQNEADQSTTRTPSIPEPPDSEGAPYPPIAIRVKRRLTNVERRFSSQTIAHQCDQLKAENLALTEELKNAKLEMKQLRSDLKATNGCRAAEATEESRQKDSQIRALNKENQQLQSKLKRTEANLKSVQVQLERRSDKSEEKELIVTLREKLHEESAKRGETENELKVLRRQCEKLAEAFKKQAELVHVLKQQKLHLEACHVLKFTKEEFLNSLDWQPFSGKEESKT